MDARAKAGAFSIGGHLPPVRGNVRLTKGFFENTLPGFVEQHRDEKIALLHVDCDLYSSTVTILQNLAEMLVPGSIIIFDELINYHGWEDGEFKAFMEFITERKLAFEYVAYNRTGGQVAVRILDASGRSRYRDGGLMCSAWAGVYSGRAYVRYAGVEHQNPDFRARRPLVLGTLDAPRRGNEKSTSHRPTASTVPRTPCSGAARADGRWHARSSCRATIRRP